MWQQLSNYLPETDLIFDSSAEYAKILVREMFTLQSKMTTQAIAAMAHFTQNKTLSEYIAQDSPLPDV